METGEIYSLLGEAYFETGDLKAAEEAFEKSLKLRHTGEASGWLEKGLFSFRVLLNPA